MGWPGIGWLGALLLIVSGYGWGRRVSSRAGSPVPLAVTLLLTLSLSVLGLGLVIRAFLEGQDGPLVTGVVGALGVFTARE